MGKSSDTWKVDRHMVEIIREIFYLKGIVTFFIFQHNCKVAKFGTISSN